MAMKLRRKLTSYRGCTPVAVASGSKAQMMFFVEDAKADITTLVGTIADAVDALQALVVQVKETSAWDDAVNGEDPALTAAVTAAEKIISEAEGK